MLNKNKKETMMRKHSSNVMMSDTGNGEHFSEITASAKILRQSHGWRAKCLQRLIRLGLPVPKTVTIPASIVRATAAGQPINGDDILCHFGAAPLISVRPSPENPHWGGPMTILNVGYNQERHQEIADLYGPQAANSLAIKFIRTYAVHVAHLDPDLFDFPELCDEDAIKEALRVYEGEAEEPFPDNPAQQLTDVLRSMARAWEGTSARLLRQAKGAPAEATLGLVVQSMAQGLGKPLGGTGFVRFIDPLSGEPQVSGRYISAAKSDKKPHEVEHFIVKDGRGSSLEDASPELIPVLCEYGAICRQKLREEMQIEFSVENGRLWVIDAIRVQRSSRAEIRTAVLLAEDGVISPEEAVMRIEPRMLSELLHPQVSTTDKRDIIAQGIPASPGAAVGRIVFSTASAQAYAARGDACILVRRETAPEDVRGMYSTAGVVTQRGGMSSHAAVIARGLGLPCVVSADFQLDAKEKVILCNGRQLYEGDMVTLDGTLGQVLFGESKMVAPGLDRYFQTLLGWADEFSDIGVRANADTPSDAITARRFDSQGIGLCRTEYMFFDEDRLTVMREMIFADNAENRAAALERLAPMQKADFLQLFEIMSGLPVCIRLFDPPLHEFLPQSREGILDLAEALDKPISEVSRRIESLAEFNPMLGMRGVRLGVVLPEIYNMQARAIFDAAVDVLRNGGMIVPEVMIPLVSAKREVEVVKECIEAVASSVRTKSGIDFTYRLGVMVETPRAALRAGELAQHASFLSFGTNDLTQMTYGMSRDDSGRFMDTYVQQGVFEEDPFHMLDIDGVGELLQIGAARGRETRDNLTLSICGEHGGNVESIAFCRSCGFDYVSCSPYRVPLARLAAAQLALADKNYTSSR